ncbi:MAG: histidine kinase [Planctomycetaceae bacterium]|nr:MAG: histidine kinase [Planctomycetaceae bacterium]
MQRRLFMQVTLPIAMVGALLLAIGLYGAWRVHRLHKRSTDIVAENVAGIRRAEQLRAIIQQSNYRLKRFSSTGDERHLDEINRLIREAHQRQRQMTPVSQTAEASPLIGRIRASIDDFSTAFGQMGLSADGRVCPQAVVQLADSAVFDDLFAALDDYIAVNDQQVDHSSRRNQTTANRLMFGLLLLGTCGGVAGLLLGYAIARRVGRTIIEVAVSLGDVAGKLNKVVGPVAVTANPRIYDLEMVLQTISQHVSTVVERLQASERETLRAEQLAAMGQLAAGMAHEIRNPLTSMKAIVQLAENPEDFSAQDIRILEEEIARLEQSVQAFLDYARPAPAEKREITLEEIVEQPLALMARRADRQGIAIVFVPPRPHLRVIADLVQLRQVVLNLLLNALEATPLEGAVRLEIARKSDENHDDSICIRVSDSGHGLPDHLGNRIFDPFVTTKETGIGLGLSISRRIVEDHGGQITAANSPQGGALFTVRLPLVSGHNQTTTPERSNSKVERPLRVCELVIDRETN